MAEILDQRAALLEQSRKMKEQAAAQAASTNIETPQPIVATPELEPTKPVAIIEPTKEIEVPTPPTTIGEETPTVQSLEDWDDSKPVTSTITDVNFEKIGSALKLEGIKSESELVTKFNELNTELNQYKEKAQAVSIIPDELKQVLEVATKGGDWKSYINPVDFSKIDPVQLYEFEVSKLPQFRNSDGTFNQVKFDEVVDAIPETQKELEGSRIAHQRTTEQIQFRQQQQLIAQQRVESQDRELVEAAKELPNLFPVEQYGMKLDNRHSETLYKGISDRSLLKKHLLKDDGSYDMKKTMATIAKAEYAEKMLKHIAGKSAVAAKKEILQQNQSIQLSTSSSSAAPEVLNEKPLGPAERLMKHFAKSQVAGQL